MKAVIEEINSTVEQNEKEEGEPEKIPEQITKPRYIENPLPLPKKHVKKEMDYQYLVEEKDMKYDVNVSETDDFDLL